ncbi:MAG: hypothetical protein GX139_10760 [Armatimonadetes bacterium]|jgi:hypothetical protein|nr:hypothetical protein [Armatimonadota bacterium]
MDCIDKIELGRFLQGTLPPDRILAIDEHLSECKSCRAALRRSPVVAGFAADVTGSNDCPEYEDLSAYVDDTLDVARAASIHAHANLCEICARDIDRIRELRSHALLRETVVVRPGMSRESRRGFFVYWRQAVAALSLGGLIAVAMLFGNSGDQGANKVPQMVHMPPITMALPAVEPEKSPEPTQPESNVAVPAPPPSAVNIAEDKPKPAPVVTTVLRDGNYTVTRSNGKLVFARSNGADLRGGARVVALIDEKLRTGKIKPAQSLKIAVASIAMRNSHAYEAPPSAPQLVFPAEKMLIEQTPTFKWSPVELAEDYRIRIFDTSGHLVAEQIVTDNTFTAAAPLTRGQVYSWRVGVRFSETDQWTESAAGGFAILSAEGYETISRAQKDFAGSHLALGAAYESAGLYDEAASEYRSLQKSNPDSSLAKKLLANM